MGKYVDFKLGQGPLVPLQCQVYTSLLWMCDRDDGIPFQASRAIDTHLNSRRGKWGSSSLVAGNSAFLSSGDRYLGKLLEFCKAFHGCFCVPRETWALFGNAVASKGLIMRAGKNFIVCVVVAGKLGFLSSCLSSWGQPVFLREVRSHFALPGPPGDTSHIPAGMNRTSSR